MLKFNQLTVSFLLDVVAINHCLWVIVLVFPRLIALLLDEVLNVPVAFTLTFLQEPRRAL